MTDNKDWNIVELSVNNERIKDVRPELTSENRQNDDRLYVARTHTFGVKPEDNEDRRFCQLNIACQVTINALSTFICRTT